MRFVHTSDWHLGRQLHGAPLVADQAHVLDQLVTLVAEARADALVVAGDLHDRAVPPAEAVELLDDTLHRIAAGAGVPVILVAGNHDSGRRLAFGARFLSAGGVHLVGPVPEQPQPVVLEDAHGRVSFHALPYAGPEETRLATGDATVHDHDAALRALVARCAGQREARSVVIAHAFVVGGEGSESERPLTVGGTGTVGADCFDGFTYAALGHLHRPQTAGAPTVRYSGSLLPYSFSETDHQKTVSVVEIDGRGAVSVEEVRLTPRRAVRVVQGPLADLLARATDDPARDDYVLARLEDRGALLDVMGKLRQAYPNVLHVERLALADAGAGGAARVDHRRQTEAELFDAFVQEVTGQAPTEAERAAFAKVADARLAAEREGTA